MFWILVTFKENFHEGNVKAGVSFWQYTVFDKTENLLLPVLNSSLDKISRSIKFVVMQTQLSCPHHRTTKLPNSESPIFTTKFLF
mgnify:CR=1 FL=1